MSERRASNTIEKQPERERGFVWPPGKAVEVLVPKESPRQPIERESSWEQIERTWLEVEAGPLPRRVEEAGVWFDRPHVYCHRCGKSVGPYEADETGCADCREERVPWDGVVRLGAYGYPWSGIVHDIKFTRWRRLGDDVGRAMGRAIRLRIEGLDERPTLVVPVPTSFRRRMSRGIDHPLVIARGVAKELGVPLWRAIGKWHRPEQAKLSATERKQNLQGSMGPRWTRNLLVGHWLGAWGGWGSTARGLRKAQELGRLRVIMIDDVKTTGSTFREATKALGKVCKSLNIKDLSVYCGAVTVTEERERKGSDRVVLGG